VITNPTELAVNRRNTAVFIAADPDSIVLTPRTKQKTGTGGFSFVEGEPRVPQDFHIIPRNNGTGTTPTRVAGGQMREVEFTLMGNWDAQIAANDIFDHDGARWEVLSVDPPNGYEILAQVVRYGA
jgi:hypothetical protein